MERSIGTVVYRPFDLEQDLAPVVTLLNEVKQADQEDDPLSEDDLRDTVRWSGEGGVRVALPAEGASPIGFGQLYLTSQDKNADLFVAVHPSWRGQGIGSQLLVQLVERAEAHGAKALRCYVDVRHEAAAGFVTGRDFVPVSTYTRLGAPASLSFPNPQFPPGWSVRSYAELPRPDLLLQAMNRAYEGLWGHLQVSEEDLTGLLPELKPDGIFLLFAPNGELAGIVRGEISGPLSTQRGRPTGHLDAPGVIPAYRDQGLYLPLLLTLIAWLLPQGPTAFELESWGDDPNTLTQYRDLGFSVLKEEISYRRVLDDIR